MRAALREILGRLEPSRWAYAITGLGLVLRLGALFLVKDAPLDSDMRGYCSTALQLLHGETFSPFWPPGLPYFLSFFFSIWGEGELVAKASILVAYVAFSFFLFGLLRELTGPAPANLAILLFAVYPAFIRYSVVPLTEMPAAACLAGVVYLGILAARKRSFGLSLAAGFLLGILVLVRSGSVLLLMIVPAFLLIKTRKPALAALPLLAALVLIGAWIRKAHEMTGRFVMICEANAFNLFIGNNPYTPLYRTWPAGQAELGFPPAFLTLYRDISSKPPGERDRLYRQSAWEHIRARPDLFLARTVNRMRTYFGFEIHRAKPLATSLETREGRELVGVALTLLNAFLYWLVVILAILAWFTCLDPARTVEYAFVLGVAALYSLPYWLAFSSPRLNFPIVPLMAVFSAWFVQRWAETPSALLFRPVAESRKRRWGMYSALGAFAFIQVEWAVAVYLKP